MGSQILPRYGAAVVDNTIAMLLGVILAKQLPNSMPLAQTGVMVVAYLAFFFLFELVFAATPGKIVGGLAVRQLDGTRCSAWQIFVRTAFRIIEVNPAFLGALPAAVAIFFSQDRRRFGDRVAGTNVVPR